MVFSHEQRRFMNQWLPLLFTKGSTGSGAQTRESVGICLINEWMINVKVHPFSSVESKCDLTSLANSTAAYKICQLEGCLSLLWAKPHLPFTLKGFTKGGDPRIINNSVDT